jgi:hypothetical protein
MGFVGFGFSFFLGLARLVLQLTPLSRDGGRPTNSRPLAAGQVDGHGRPAGHGRPSFFGRPWPANIYSNRSFFMILYTNIYHFVHDGDGRTDSHGIKKNIRPANGQLAVKIFLAGHHPYY